MNKKSLIGIIVVIVGLVIAAAILRNPVWAMFIPEVALVGVWIYLVWMVRKKKAKIFHEGAARTIRTIRTIRTVGVYRTG